MVWSILATPAKSAERKTWEERFEDLLQYKEEHGTTRVPQSYPGLGNWVHSQRVGYHLMKKGRETHLTAEKAVKLAEAGFAFVVAPRKKKVPQRDLYNPHPHLARRAAEASKNNQNLSAEHNEENEDNEDDDGDDDAEEEDVTEEEIEEAIAARVQWRPTTNYPHGYLPRPSY